MGTRFMVWLLVRGRRERGWMRFGYQSALDCAAVVEQRWGWPCEIVEVG